MSQLAIRWARDLDRVGPATRPEGHLLGTLLIAGVPHHVEAFEVEEREGVQESVLGDNETSFGELSEIAQGPMLTVTIGIENFTGGMGSAAFVAYLSSLCNVAFTATQYALPSSLASPIIAVSKAPGAIAKIRMPKRASSRAIGSVIPATAALLAE